ncbi:hypothetical protein [Microbacterium kunmingense]|uniref:hypothetical protein n=1 Tax=Microbacterium kunmingense TaxID=2915939 RepID=UPI0020036C40|nr:hypothetical protein [Microbacterium kunmingense]
MAVDNNGNSGFIINDSLLVDDSVNDSGNGNSLASGNSAFSGNTAFSDNTYTDNSVVDGSTNNSDNTDVAVDVAIGSGNTSTVDDSDNSWNDYSDNNSHNDYEDSNNDYTDSFNDYTLIDRSVAVGVRQYNTNVNNNYDFGGAAAGGAAAAAGGGHFSLDNRTTVVDQSVNQNIEADGPVFQAFGQSANVASGDGSVAAGDDAIVDNSQTAISIGDISAFNTTYDVAITDSFNEEWNFESNNYSIDIDDSGNSWTETNELNVGIDGSFNDYASWTETNDVSFENSGNIGSPFGIAGNELDF